MKALRRYVERVVRPIQASNFRKDRMREELLAHLSRLYAEEQIHAADEVAAFAQATGRFGDARALSRELQASVPRIERWAFLPLPGIGWMDRRPGEPMNAFLFRSMSWQIRFNALLWIPAILAGALLARTGSPWTTALFMLLEAVVGQLTISGCTLLCELIRRELHGSERAPVRGRRAALRVAAYTIICMGLGGSFVAATVALLQHLNWPLVSGAWFWGITTLAASAAAPLVHLAAWESAVMNRRFEEWGTLDLEAEPTP